MKKFFILIAVAAMAFAAQAAEVTVTDGTESCQYAPLHSYNYDMDQHNQMQYPAAELAGMAAGTEITAMKFYTKNPDLVNLMGGSVKVSLANMDNSLLEAASDPALMATDLAEALVRQGVPFREAHHQVGRFVGACARKGITLAQADLAFMQEAIPTATPEFLKIFNPKHSVSARDIIGGTAPSQVHAQLLKWAKQFGATMPSTTKKSKK